MCSCTSCTARALGCRAGRLLLLLGVRGLCAPKFGRKTTGTRVVLLLLGPGSGSSRFSPSCFPPSGLALLADSVSLSGVALAGSALPQSTSSSWPSVSPPLPQQPLHSPRRAGQHLPQLGSVWLWHLSRLAVVSSSQPLFFPLAAAWPLLSSLCLAFGSSPRGCS